MEYIILIVLVLFGLPFIIRLFSSNETKLLRRIWSSEKFSNFDAQREAYDELLHLCGVKIISGVEGQAKEELEENIMSLVGKAIEFDVKHPNNGGVKVVSVVIRQLLCQLNTAGIEDFDENLNNAQNIDYAAMAKSLDGTLK